MDDDRPAERSGEHFESALAAVRGRSTLSNEQLEALSVLEGPALERFREVWSTLDARARRELVESLRASADERARLDFGPINLLALDDASEAVRLAGVQAAFEDRQPRLLQRLLELLRADPSVEVRAAAAEDLARFALLAELGDLDADASRLVRERLVEAVRDPDQDARVRQAALAAAGYFSDADMAGMLATGFTNPDLRLGAVRGMGRSADPRWTPQLLEMLGSDDPRLRLETVRALAEIEDERAVEPLGELLDDPDEAIQLAVIRALGDIGGDEAREMLLYLLEDPNDTIRQAADEAIRQLEFYEDPLGL
jgi:HEAT repeat protein